MVKLHSFLTGRRLPDQVHVGLRDNQGPIAERNDGWHSVQKLERRDLILSSPLEAGL